MKKENDTAVQQKISKRGAHLAPWQYKKGQSGNPAGRAKGISLKEYVKMQFAHMSDEEQENFLHGLNKGEIWKMGEGNPDTKTDLTSGGEKIDMNIIDIEQVKAFNEWSKQQTKLKKK